MEHELPLKLIDRRPDLALRLARSGGLDLPKDITAKVVSSDLTRITSVVERRADRALLLSNEQGEPKGVLVVEVQRSTDAEARNRWPGKVSTAYERHGCAVYLLVICPDASVADWAARPVVIGDLEGPGMALRMLVIPPNGIPRVTDVGVARAEPELAVLSILGHGAHPTVDNKVTKAVLDGFCANATPAERATNEEEIDYAEYLYYLFDVAPQVVQDQMEDYLMKIDTENSYAWHRFPPLVKARIKARAEGVTEGKAEGEASAVLLVLRRRGIDLDRAQTRRILDCGDSSQLENWLLRAVTATSVADVLDDELESSDL